MWPSVTTMPSVVADRKRMDGDANSRSTRIDHLRQTWPEIARSISVRWALTGPHDATIADITARTKRTREMWREWCARLDSTIDRRLRSPPVLSMRRCAIFSVTARTTQLSQT